MQIVKYNQGSSVSRIGFLFACPGQKELAANKVVAGITGKNLNILLEILSESKSSKIRHLFPSRDRYDYLITNTSEIVHYPALDGRSLPARSEYKTNDNAQRLLNEFQATDYVIAFGEQARDMAKFTSAQHDVFTSHCPVFITSLPHLSLLAINQIKCDIDGVEIPKGDPCATRKRLEVVAKMAETELLNAMKNVTN